MVSRKAIKSQVPRLAAHVRELARQLGSGAHRFSFRIFSTALLLQHGHKPQYSTAAKKHPYNQLSRFLFIPSLPASFPVHLSPPPRPPRQAECSRYFGDNLLRPIAYAGSPRARRRLAERLGLGLTAAAAAAAADNHSDDDNDDNADDGNSRTACDMDMAAAERERERKGGGEGGHPERANVLITSYSVLRTDARVLGDQVNSWLD